MMTKVLTLRFNPLTGAFDDHSLNEFIKDKNLISVQNHFFVYEGQPYLALVIDYRPGDPLTPEDQLERRRRREENWKEKLSSKALPLFNTLRQWRSAKSRSDGLPHYQIATNMQFVEMAEKRPQSLTALKEIDGFGDAKAAKYGQEILEILLHEPPSVSSPEGDPENVKTEEQKKETDE